MAKYLLLWEMDRTKIPVDIKERAVGLGMLIGIVKQDIKNGFIKDWGVFPGEFAGYSVVEESEVELMTFVQKYTPFVYFKVHPTGSVKDVDKMLKDMTK